MSFQPPKYIPPQARRNQQPTQQPNYQPPNQQPTQLSNQQPNYQPPTQPPTQQQNKKAAKSSFNPQNQLLTKVNERCMDEIARLNMIISDMQKNNELSELEIMDLKKEISVHERDKLCYLQLINYKNLEINNLVGMLQEQPKQRRQQFIDQYCYDCSCDGFDDFMLKYLMLINEENMDLFWNNLEKDGLHNVPRHHTNFDVRVERVVFTMLTESINTVVVTIHRDYRTVSYDTEIYIILGDRNTDDFASMIQQDCFPESYKTNNTQIRTRFIDNYNMDIWHFLHKPTSVTELARQTNTTLSISTTQ